MMTYRFKDVSVTSTLLLVVTLVLLITSLILASEDNSEHFDNEELASLDDTDMKLFADFGSEDNNQKNDIWITDCVKKAKEIANIEDDSNDFDQIKIKLQRFIKNSTNSSSPNLQMVCGGLNELFECFNLESCKHQDYFNSSFYNEIVKMNTLSLYKKKCNFPAYQPVCNATLWGKFHQKPYPGECVPDDDKLKCVQKVEFKFHLNSTHWEVGLRFALNKYSLLMNDHKKRIGCQQILSFATCEMNFGCKKCKKPEQENLENFLLTLLRRIEKHCKQKIHPKIELKDSCTEKPTSSSTQFSSSKQTSSTSSSKTLIIILAAVALILLVIGGIVLYCCLFSGGKRKKKPDGKQEMASKQSVVSSSKINNRKSSSVIGGKKSQVQSKLAGGSKVGGSKKAASKSVA